MLLLIFCLATKCRIRESKIKYGIFYYYYFFKISGKKSGQSGKVYTVMNCLSQVSSYTAAIFRRTSHFVPRSSLYGCGATFSGGQRKHIGVKAISLELVLTRLRVQCYSSKRGAKSASSRTRKLDSEPVMEQEKDAFFVVRKGDIVGIYKNLTDCQAQVGSSVIPFCHPII